MSEYPAIQVIGITGMGEIAKGSKLSAIILKVASVQGTPIIEHDILVVTQKIVSKAEGSVVDLSTIHPSDFAKSFALRWGKDPRHVEVILQESRRIVRMEKGVLITETYHGFICANAGVDASNVPGSDNVCLLPKEPDTSAKSIRNEIYDATGLTVAVIISDTFGRPWREGTTNVAIGIAGINPIKDYRGVEDSYGYELKSSVAATADEIAASAELVSNKTAHIPVSIIRGLQYDDSPGSINLLIRDPSKDLFR